MAFQKNALITGANQGIGFSTACGLARKGYNLVLACRNESNAQKAVKMIRQENPSIVVEYVLVDLASIQSTHNCIRTLAQNGHQFDVIVLNAGVCRSDQTRTVDGYETTFQVNYLSQYILAQHIINNQTRPVRIVTLTSFMYKVCELVQIPRNSEKWLPMFNGVKNQVKAYALSKFCMALLSQAFNQQEGVTSVSVHPGIVPTNIFVNSVSKISQVFINSIIKNKLTTVETAAEHVLYCVENEIPPGNFYCAGHVSKLTSTTRNPHNVQNLIQMNEQLIHLHNIPKI